MKRRIALGVANLLLMLSLGIVIMLYPPDALVFIVVFLLMTVLFVVGVSLIYEKDNA